MGLPIEFESKISWVLQKVNMALTYKYSPIVLVLVVCFTTSLGQNDMHSMEAKHRSIGHRPPSFTYFAPQQPVIYGVPPRQRVPSYPAPRPTYTAPPSYLVRPSYQTRQPALRVPAYHIPYPNPRPNMPNYSAPVIPRQPATSVTQRAPATPIYGQPPPFRTQITPSKVPFTHSAPHPSPNTYRPPSPPVTGPSLLDLPWVKPLYARTPPATGTYSWNAKEINPAVPVSPEDNGIRISSVNTVQTTTPVRSQDFQVRVIPQETVASNAPSSSAIVPVTTATTFVIQDESEEDIQIFQEVTSTRTPLPTTSPFLIRDDDSQVMRFAPLPVTAQTPLAVIIRDDSEEDVQIVQSLPSVSLSTTTQQVQNAPVILQDESNEAVQIVQQVNPFVPRTITQPSINPILIRDDSNEDIRIVPQMISSTPSPMTAVAPVNAAIIIRDDSIEDTQTFQRVQLQQQQVSTTNTPSLPPMATSPPLVNPIIIQDDDDSIENVQILVGQQVQPLSTPSTRTTPAIPVAAVLDDSNERDEIVQAVVLNVPATRPTEATISQAVSLVNLDISDEDILFRDVPLSIETVTNFPVLASFPANSQLPTVITTLFDEDSAEDVRIFQTAPGSATISTVSQVDSLEVRPDVSNEDIELRIISQRVTPSSISNTESLSIISAPSRVVLVDSVEDTRRNPEVSISNVQLSTPLAAGDVLLVDSNENFRIAQNVSISSVQVSGPLSGTSEQSPIVLVDSAEDIQNVQQQLSLFNASGPAVTPRIILVESAEEIQPQTLNPILQSPNIVLNPDSQEISDRSDEDQIRTTVTISQVSINLANSTSL